MNQREVWESIAADYGKYRRKPLFDSLEFLKNKKGLVLDLACGNGRNFTKIKGTIVGMDFSGNMIRAAKRRANAENISVELVVGNALSMPFKDNMFDSVLFSSSFHCVKWNKRKAVLKEVKRVAKNRADIFISVWNRDQPRFANAAKESYIPWKVGRKVYPRYYYLYSKDELEALLKKHFKNVKVFGSAGKAFKRYPKNIIAIAKVRKT